MNGDLPARGVQSRLALLVACLLLLPAASAQWPAFQHDERHSGALPGNEYAPYKAVWWERDIEGAIQLDASPVLEDGVLIVTGWNKILWAMDATTGTPLWNHTFDARIQSTPAIADNFVYAVDVKGNLKKFTLRTGNLIDSAKVSPSVAPLTVHQGNVYIGGDDGKMHALLANGLTTNWKFDTASVVPGSTFANNKTTCQAKLTAQRITGGAVVYGSAVIFGTHNNWVYAVNENGNGDGTTNVRWIYKTGDAIFGSPAVDVSTGNVIVGSYDRKVHALPATFSGSTTGGSCNVPPQPAAKWTFNVPDVVGESRISSTPAIADGNVYVGALNGFVYALNPQNGQKVWEHYTGNAVEASPVAANKWVVAANNGGRVVWLHAANGTIDQEYRMDAQIKASPALVRDRTYVAAFDGSLAMLGASAPDRPDLTVSELRYDGEVKLTVTNSGKGTAPPTLVQLELDGTFLADLRINRTIPSGESWSLNYTIDGPPENFKLTALVDPKNEIAESDENNNGAEFDLNPSPGETAEPEPTSGNGNGGGGRGRGVPGPALPLVLVGLAVLAVRRRS